MSAMNDVLQNPVVTPTAFRPNRGFAKLLR